MLDAVLAECSLSGMEDPDAALAEFRRVLRPGGWLILADLYLRNPVGLPQPREQQPVSCLRGALPRTQIEDKLAEQGFDRIIWQDRSETLKVLAARLILAGISPARFWGGSCSEDTQAINHLRPGYYWLICTSGAEGHGRARSHAGVEAAGLLLQPNPAHHGDGAAR